MSLPIISIITPVYNAEAFIRDTITSVQNQTFRNYEHILVDDGSKDSSQEIILSFCSYDDRIKYYKNDYNLGVAETRNKGLEVASGEYICFLDADDLWHPTKLQKQIDFIHGKNLELACSSYSKIDERGKVKGSPIIVPSRVGYKDLLNSNSIPCLTAIGKSSILKNTKFKKVGHEDYLYWLEILGKGLTMYGQEDPLAFYRVRNDSISGNKKNAALFQWKIYRTHLQLSLIQSIYHFTIYSFKGLYKYTK